jgi:hypothetical protein
MSISQNLGYYEKLLSVYAINTLSQLDPFDPDNKDWVNSSKQPNFLESGSCFIGDI